MGRRWGRRSPSIASTRLPLTGSCAPPTHSGGPTAHSSSPMLERNIQLLATDDPREEGAAAIRERLKVHFPPGATRRMTSLGLLVGSVLEQMLPGEGDSIVYATGYAESCALEGFLESFPTPSPTLFQTSIHP